MISGTDFDHVALAAESGAVLQARYRDQLGGRPLAGGSPPGFIWNQLEFANGAIVEMLEPDRVDENDFLRRFLDRQGPGPHHLTFKVPDFRAALAAAEVAGYPPVGVDESDTDWKEAFLHPKDAPGVVVQLAESHEHHDPPVADPSVPTASFDHVAHAVRSLDDGLRLFEGLLGGTPIAEGSAGDSRWIELAWAGPGRVRLVEPTGPGDLDEWLGERVGRVHHLAFSVADPTAITGAVGSGRHWWVEPATNFGTRLLLVADPSLRPAS